MISVGCQTYPKYHVCDKGDMKGCFNFGLLEYKKGNVVKAQNLWQKACDGGVMRGCFNLGVLEKDNGNIVKAQNLYRKARSRL